MLTHKERSVLKAVLLKCGDKSGCLASADDLAAMLPARPKISEAQMKQIIECLDYDGYFDVVMTQRKGVKLYCITLRARGKGYLRESVQSQRYLFFRVALAIGSALITFAVGRLLYAIIR